MLACEGWSRPIVRTGSDLCKAVGKASWAGRFSRVQIPSGEGPASEAVFVEACDSERWDLYHGF